MERRDFLAGAGLGALAAGLSACGKTGECPPAAAAAASAGEKFVWKMYTTWPKNFPGLGTAANYLADAITRGSGGRLTVKLYGAGERVPALEVFDAVSRGAAEMGHSAAYYWKGKAPASVFFTCVPFGLTAQEMNGWLYYGGGMELWRELYAKFNLVPFEAGNTGTQMGGWFRKEIRSLADLQGLKMRIPGLGGEVMARVGATTVNIPGGELFTALDSGAIDATEWVGPYNDLAFGFYKAAKHYYYPGWHEPGPTLEAIVNKDAWARLPPDLQAVVETASAAAGQRMLAEYTARNQQALETLVKEHGVKLHAFPREVIAALRTASEAVVSELAKSDEFAGRVYQSYSAFKAKARKSTELAELAYLNLERP